MKLETVILPVEAERSSVPADVFSTQIFPVLVLIIINFEAEAKKLTSPVLNDISTPSNLKFFGISISPVLPLMKSEVYSAFGR